MFAEECTWGSSFYFWNLIVAGNKILTIRIIIALLFSFYLFIHDLFFNISFCQIG